MTDDGSSVWVIGATLVVRYRTVSAATNVRGMKPLIGLVGRRKKGSQVDGMPEVLVDIDIDVYLADYSRAIAEAGGLPILLPVDADPAEYVGHIDGVVLTGGTDIDPARYGHSPHAELIAPEDERDELEFALMDGAIEKGIPVLGICRGLQVVNVHGGGTLHQDVPAHSRFDVAPETAVHPVEFAAGSVLAGLYGDRRDVNSLHHQTVDDVAPGYVVSARGDDGEVEGLEHESLPVVSVQWHPEMMASRATDPIFGWLVEAAVSWRS